jgi:hypothetical protein
MDARLHIEVHYPVRDVQIVVQKGVFRGPAPGIRAHTGNTSCHAERNTYQTKCNTPSEPPPPNREKSPIRARQRTENGNEKEAAV